MDASRRATRDLTCPFGHQFRAVIWDVLDLDQHSRLRTEFQELLSVECPTCGASAELTTPVLLVNAVGGVPVISLDNWTDDDAAGREKVRRALDTPVAPPPGMLINISRGLLGEVFTSTDRVDLRRRLANGEFAETDGARRLAHALDEQHVAALTLHAFTTLDEDTPAADLARATAELGLVGNVAVQRYLVDVVLAAPADDIDRRFAVCRVRFIERLISGDDPAGAQSQLRQDIAHLVSDQLLPELQAALTGLSGDKPADTYDRAIRLAHVLGNRGLEAHLRYNRAFDRAGGAAFFDAATVDLLESDLRTALDLADGLDPDLHARCSANLAMVVAQKSTGDRAANLEESIGLLHRCLGYFTEDTSPDFWAMNCTNLSVCYVNRIRGDKRENLDTAEALCRAALRVRSKERNPVDWAFTLTNLAYVHIERSPVDGADGADQLAEALQLSEQAAVAFREGGALHQAAGALHNAAVAALQQVRRSLHEQSRAHAEAALSLPDVRELVEHSRPPERSDADWLIRLADLAKMNPPAIGRTVVPEWAARVADPVPSDADRALLDAGRRLSDQACALRSTIRGIGLALSYKQQEEFLALAGASTSERADVLERALAVMPVEDMPAEVLDIAVRLGALYGNASDWENAARTYTTATSALNWVYRELASETSQMSELSKHYKIIELGAFALAMSGRPDEAVVLLENGRARSLGAEIARDSMAIAALRTTQPALADELERTQQQIRRLGRTAPDRDRPGDPLAVPDSAGELRRTFARILDRIRAIDGFSDFLTGVPRDDIAAASLADFPLAYLVATPAGSLTLVVEPSAEAGELAVSAAYTKVTSGQLVCCLNRFGLTGGGLLSSRGDELDGEITRAQQLLGEAFGNTLLDTVRSRGAAGVRIVPGGLLATLPLSTALVADDPDEKPLAELTTVSVAASAHVHNVSQGRARRRARGARTLVGAADPEGADPLRRLPWSRAELRAIGRLYGAEHTSTAEGAAATRDFLIENVADASHVHLSLHGRSAATDAMQSAVTMADGPLTAAELRESTRLTARVVVVSACESGRIGIADAPNEFRGLPYAMIACGAASVVASLWPVDDMATSLLMVRFHEELRRLEAAAQDFSTDLVARALASAQAWLRRMSFAEMDDYVARHDLLPGRGGPGDRDRGLWTAVKHRLRSGRPPQRPPFADPRHWASFVAIG